MSMAVGDILLAEDQGKAHKYNAELSVLKGREAVRQGQDRSARAQLEGRALQSSQRAAAAGQGVDLSAGGTITSIQEGTAATVGHRMRQIKNNAALAARGHQFEADAHEKAADMAIKAGYMNAMGTLVQEFGNFEQVAAKNDWWRTTSPSDDGGGGALQGLDELWDGLWGWISGTAGSGSAP